MHSYLSYMRHTAQRPGVSVGAAMVVLVMIASGVFGRVRPPVHIVVPLMGLFLFWLAWELYRGISQFWAIGRSYERSYASYMGLGLALLGSCGTLLQLSGGLYSPFYPLLFLTIAFLASIGTSRQGAVWFGYAFLLELTAVLAAGPFTQGVVGLAALHLVYLALFAGSHHVYLHGMLRELSEKRNQKRQSSRSHMSQAAHETRAPSEGMTAASLASIDQDRQVLLSRLKEGLDAHGCALLWLDAEGEYVEVAAIETDAPHFDIGPFPVHAGAPARLFKGESAMRLSRSGDHKIQLPYYDHDVRARSWMAIPIRQDGITRGALCADRIHPVPFSAREETILEATAIVLSRALESERSLLQSNQELEHLSQLEEIGHLLSEAPTEMALTEQALEMAMHLVPFDWAFLTRLHPEENNHTVLATTPEVAYLYHQTFSYEGSLLSLAAKHGCALPEKGILRTSGPLVSTEDPPLPELASLLILPLIQRNETIGCMVMASQDPQLFAEKEREKKLHIFSQQVASALANTHYSHQIEHLVRCDSLTGLANHSTFMDGLHEAFASSSHSQPTPPRLCLMMFNIDHFREINARYGHLTGDHVLQRVAKVLKDMSEGDDLVARYSGKELVMLCKDLDTTRGLKFADHICKQISQMELISSDADPEMFSVTVSVGLAVCPDHAAEPETLLHHTIEAMIQAKQRGGDQTVLFASDEDGISLNTPNPDAQASVTPPQGWGWGSLPSLEDPHHLVDPERWSLASFGKDRDHVSFNDAIYSTPPTATPDAPHAEPTPEPFEDNDDILLD